MKHLQSFSESNSNLELKISLIKEKYSVEDVERMFDEEWPNWVDLDWDIDNYFGTDWDWYVENVGDAAQLVVLDMLIDDDTITEEERGILDQKLIEIYPILAPL
jgi:hypothetical protein